MINAVAGTLQTTEELVTAFGQRLKEYLIFIGQMAAEATELVRGVRQAFGGAAEEIIQGIPRMLICLCVRACVCVCGFCGRTSGSSRTKLPLQTVATTTRRAT